MALERIPSDSFADVFAATTELSSAALGGQVLSVSDEFFAEAFHLLLVEPAIGLKGQFGPNGALYSGWETRRHNPDYDWCIVRLGAAGTICGFDIDTSYFNGNEAPEASVDILHDPSPVKPTADDPRWTECLPKVKLGPDSRHLFKIAETSVANFVRLRIYPDGGVARFRVYGHVSPVLPVDETELLDLSHVFAGGHVEKVSDQHFGVGSNIILPGRGKDMGCGWETKRSRTQDHKDWVIIRLGTLGILEHVEIDTNHFKGNYPESCEMHGLLLDPDQRMSLDEVAEQDWVLLLPRTKLGPHKQHYFQLEDAQERKFSHVKLTIYPDGGIQRLRVMGRRQWSGNHVHGDETHRDGLPEVDLAPNNIPSVYPSAGVIPVLPLTPEAFAPFGQVIQAYEDRAATPKGTRVTPANGDTAWKFHKLTLLQSSYPTNSNATAGISVYRCRTFNVPSKGLMELKTLERHLFTNQAFIPMNKGEHHQEYLVVVAKNGKDDKPDLQSVRAFIAREGQGIVYNAAVWHQPMTVLGEDMDFACVETQIGDGSAMDCEIVDLAERVTLRLPTGYY